MRNEQIMNEKTLDGPKSDISYNYKGPLDTISGLIGSNIKRGVARQFAWFNQTKWWCISCFLADCRLVCFVVDEKIDVALKSSQRNNRIKKENNRLLIKIQFQSTNVASCHLVLVTIYWLDQLDRQTSRSSDSLIQQEFPSRLIRPFHTFYVDRFFWKINTDRGRKTPCVIESDVSNKSD